MDSLPNVFLDRARSLPMAGNLNMRNNRINNLNSNPQIGLDVANKNHVDLVVRKSDLTFIYIVFKPPFRHSVYERRIMSAKTAVTRLSTILLETLII